MNTQNMPRYFHCPHCDSYFKEDRLVIVSTGERGHSCGAIPERLCQSFSMQLSKLELAHTRRVLEEVWKSS